MTEPCLRQQAWQWLMGNADEEIKAMADDVTLSNDEDGVAAAIEKWVL